MATPGAVKVNKNPRSRKTVRGVFGLLGGSQRERERERERGRKTLRTGVGGWKSPLSGEAHISPTVGRVDRTGRSRARGGRKTERQSDRETESPAEEEDRERVRERERDLSRERSPSLPLLFLSLFFFSFLSLPRSPLLLYKHSVLATLNPKP